MKYKPTKPFSYTLKLFTGFIVVVFFTLVISGQDFKYGKPDDLKGLKKVSIDANVKNRERIVREIEKTDLEVVQSEEEAEIILIFGGMVTIIQKGHTEQFVAGYVFVKSQSKLRVVMSLKVNPNQILAEHPATRFARKFIFEYKQANGLRNSSDLANIIEPEVKKYEPSISRYEYIAN